MFSSIGEILFTTGAMKTKIISAHFKDFGKDDEGKDCLLDLSGQLPTIPPQLKKNTMRGTLQTNESCERDTILQHQR